MTAQLVIESSLSHDGDGVVSIYITATNSDFGATVRTWASSGSHLELAEQLSGFPSSSESVVEYSFGTPSSGACALRFACADKLGNLGLRVSIVSTYPMAASGEHETATLYLSCEPHDIDCFARSLKAFKMGQPNVAKLIRLAPSSTFGPSFQDAIGDAAANDS